MRSLRAGQTLVRRGRWVCTSRVDTAIDIMRWGPVDDAVVVLDQLVEVGMVRLFDVREAVTHLPPCRGSAQARAVALLADGFAQSPQETRLRLLLGRAGLPAPVAQFRVFDEQGPVARVDLAYPDLRLATERDGAWHGDGRAVVADRQRINRLNAAGWFVLHVTAADMRRPDQLVTRIRELRAQRATMINTP